MDTRYNLNRLAYFVATVEEHTITAAAARLGLSKAVVSKHLQLLEEEVGVSLLVRNTRNIQPTEAGMEFYQDSKTALQQAQMAFERVLERSTVPSGKLRVTATVDFGILYVAPLVARFRELVPRVEINLTLSDTQMDIVEQRYDVAFRVGWLKDSSNRARKLRSFNEVAVCTPATLEQHPVEKPEDLASLAFVALTALDEETRWQFHRGNEIRTIKLQTAMIMNIALSAREAVKAGGCFTIMPDFLVTEEFAAKRLVSLLPDWSLREGGVYALTPPSRLRSSAAQTFLDMAHDEFS